MSAAVLVMAKAPRPGNAKTRLEPLLGRRGAAALQAVLIRSTLDWAQASVAGSVFLAYAPPGAARQMAAIAPGAALFPQRDGDLGARLRAAMARSFGAGTDSLLIVGTDTPTLEPRHAVAALELLDQGCDVCFGPAADGGYYLAALAHPAPAAFDIPAEAWGGREVLRLSIEAAERAGLRVGVLDELERDIDTPADAAAALADPRTPAWVAAALGAEIIR
jgi:rSAM/selenodomain-associated transferase 1